MQLLEVSGAVRPIYGSLGVKRLKNTHSTITDDIRAHVDRCCIVAFLVDILCISWLVCVAFY